ncbi:MAG: hypothetical protein AVDCRST_MAG76-599 [uncultured Acidimicrobiales bacterium]|uniref:Uncharacterized protein n=1 Tax=uncultured Acidimicrobiales bacterium TaxID=310071 RepID=A0A6J4HBE6_9ACTN|nr:MAG: hypothetical protein AVDCRST_MAG76-599 [uncultured Acidimicrobiales bacterium]
MTTVLAHGGSAGLLIEVLILGLPAALFGLFALVSRKRSKRSDAEQPAVEPEPET